MFVKGANDNRFGGIRATGTSIGEGRWHSCGRGEAAEINMPTLPMQVKVKQPKGEEGQELHPSRQEGKVEILAGRRKREGILASSIWEKGKRPQHCGVQ